MTEDQDIVLEDGSVEEEVGADGEEPRFISEEEQQFLQNVLLNLPPECQMEFHMALTENQQLSGTCQAEVEKAVRMMQPENMHNQLSEEELGEDPTIYILAVVVIVFFAVGIKVYNISQEMSKVGDQPRKKLSKKKQMKQKMKEQRKGQQVE